MIFNFDFSEVLNFDAFIKQARHYMSIMPNITYFINVSNFKLSLAWSKVSENNFNLKIQISEVINKDNLLSGKILNPLDDLRFKDLLEIKNTYSLPYSEGMYVTSSIDDGLNFMIRMVKILHKINKINFFV